MIKIKLTEDWVEYVPEWNDNRDNKDPIKCKIKYVSQEDQDRLTDNMIGQQRDGFRSKKGMKWTKAQRSMVNEHVKDISGVLVEDKEGNEHIIKEMKDLYKIPQLKGLYIDIADALDAGNNLEDFEIKN